jgi:hypothetical protein
LSVFIRHAAELASSIEKLLSSILTLCESKSHSRAARIANGEIVRQTLEPDLRVPTITAFECGKRYLVKVVRGGVLRRVESV